MKYNYILSLLLIIVPSITLACQPITSPNKSPWALAAVVCVGVIGLFLFYSYIRLYRSKGVIFSKTSNRLLQVNIIVFVASFLWLTIGLNFFTSAGLMQSDFLATCETIYSPFYEYIHPFIKIIFSVSFYALIISGIMLVFKKSPVLNSKK